MKKNVVKISTILIIIIIVLSSLSFTFAASDAPKVTSEAVILMDKNTEKILYEKNATEKMYPASTTKILTAILTIENLDLNENVTISENAVTSIPEGYVTADLQVGEILTVEQLLEILLLHSANDAAVALAEHVGGTVDSFVSMMNTKINELGLSNTHFTNPYGRQDPNHYSTAYDMAIIMKYCMDNEEFRKIDGLASCAIPATNLHEPRMYSSSNRMIDPSDENYYPYITAGKTGFTTQAGECFISCSYKDDIELIAVVLGGEGINDPQARFSDTKSLYEYGYSNYSLKNIVDADDIVYQMQIPNATKETRNLNLIAKNSINALVNNNFQNTSLTPEVTLKTEDISAPIDEGEVLATAKYTVDGEEYEVDLVADHSVEKSQNEKLAIEIIFILIILVLLIKYFKSKKRA